jgi:peptide/nickel transport system substrate-binding protein
MTLRARIPLSLVAATAATALLLGACSSSKDDDTVATPNPSAPGPLTIATSFAIDDLDPLENSFWGPEFGYVELLMRPDPSGTPTPWVLKELTNVGPTTWKLVLNDGVRFEDGRALDATALVELLTYVNAENDSFAAAVHFGSATASGPLEVTLATAKPVPGLANILADESNVPVFDVAAYKKHLAARAKPEALLTAGLYTGPYVMTSLSTETAELKPVPGYWAGTPGLSSLTIKFVPEATARVQAVQAGEADIALYMPTATAQTLKGRSDAFFVTGKPAGTTFAIQLRNKGAYADALVRRAVFAAVDYRELAEDVLSGLAQQSTSAFGSSVPYAVDTQVTDLAEAKRLLHQAGWTGDTGTRTKGGQKLTLRLLSYPQQPDSDTIAVALQSQLKKVGIEVKVSQVPDITESRKGDAWDAAIVGDSLLSFALSPIDGLRESLGTGAEENYMKISDGELDEVIADLGVEFDPAKRDALLKQAQAIIHDNGLWAATVQRLPAVVTNPTWKTYTPPISNLWVDATTAPTS